MFRVEEHAKQIARKKQVVSKPEPDPSRWMQYVHSNYRYISIGLHGTASQKVTQLFNIRSFEFIITWFHLDVTIHHDGNRVERIET